MNNHINHDTLKMFVRTTALADYQGSANISMSSAPYREVLDHLATCEECRNQVSMISELQERWPDIEQHSELSDDQHQLICDYVDGSLPSEEAKQVKSLIGSQPDALKAALHYQSHSDQMQQALAASDDAGEDNKPSIIDSGSMHTSLINRLNQFFSFRSPMVYTMALTASLIAAVMILLQHPTIQQDRIMIASYQDNPTIQFTEQNKLPGIGFFSQAGNDSRPFEDITIELIADNMIKISWPEVAGATLYKLRIQVFNQGKKTVLIENSTQANHTSFQLGPEKPDSAGDSSHNRRYEWVLYGNTQDDRTFYASGGFVISKVDTGADIW